DAAVAARGRSFTEALALFERMSSPPQNTPAPRRVGVLHAGGLAPGMNTAARAAERLGLTLGMQIVGVDGGFPGLISKRVRELSWGDVDGWAADGGADLGTRRHVPTRDELPALAAAIENLALDALLVIGGYSAYEAVSLLHAARAEHAGLQLPIVCVPASIDNNLPRSELSIGSDTALNSAVVALDAVKMSASASRRCFVTETMGRRCGYLAFMAGLASGAERVYLHEEGISLDVVQEDVERMKAAFRRGKRLYLTIRSEYANEHYTTDVLARLFEEESEGLFDVRQVVFGHVQQGGTPTPFDRIIATRLVEHALDEVAAQLDAGECEARTVGFVDGAVSVAPVADMAEHLDLPHRRPAEQWWLTHRPVLDVLSQEP
ncbi:MAG: 6-phosphofructokinase, partial [Mobilicoccus sp.]|nr:6-phosphofructokinase [Mobilicoccus sp.]